MIKKYNDQLQAKVKPATLRCLHEHLEEEEKPYEMNVKRIEKDEKGRTHLITITSPEIHHFLGLLLICDYEATTRI